MQLLFYHKSDSIINVLSYHQRLSVLNLTTLETRRLRLDLIEVFTILKGFHKVNCSWMFSLAANNLRGHGLKLYKSRFNTNLGKFTFSNLVVDEWNMLPDDVILSNTVLSFKIKLDRYIKNGRGLI